MKATVKTLAAIVAMVATSATLPARADTVTADTALAAAKGWVNLRQSMDGGALSAPESAKAYSGADGKGTYYVVSLSGGGYVVTSGDTFLKPVLSYASSGAWEENEAKNPLGPFRQAVAACADRRHREARGHPPVHPVGLQPQEMKPQESAREENHGN